MDALTPDIREICADDPAIAPMLERHVAVMRASSPACSVHAMDGAALSASNARVFGAFLGGRPLGMGAFRRIDPKHGELKSMHVAEEARGRGIARALLAHLIAAAQSEGLSRVSLETGSQPVFAAARALYLSAGFTICPPFDRHRPDPNSVFLTRSI